MNFHGNTQNYFIYCITSFSIKKELYEDFSVRHSKSYYKCLKKFIDSKKNLLLNEAIMAQKICAEALHKGNNN